MPSFFCEETLHVRIVPPIAAACPKSYRPLRCVVRKHPISVMDLDEDISPYRLVCVIHEPVNPLDDHDLIDLLSDGGRQISPHKLPDL